MKEREFSQINILNAICLHFCKKHHGIFTSYSCFLNNIILSYTCIQKGNTQTEYMVITVDNSLNITEALTYV
jgi:hypothetical protein